MNRTPKPGLRAKMARELFLDGSSQETSDNLFHGPAQQNSFLPKLSAPALDSQLWESPRIPDLGRLCLCRQRVPAGLAPGVRGGNVEKGVTKYRESTKKKSRDRPGHGCPTS